MLDVIQYDEDHIQHCAADLCCLDKTDDVGRAFCFEDAPTSSPSMAPSGPTTSPTMEPTTKEFLEEKPVSEMLNFIFTMTLSNVYLTVFVM